MSAFAALAGMAMFLQSSTNSLNMNATTDTFSTGLASMATYLGDTILPISAGLGIAFGLYEYSQRGNGEKYITGALAMLLVSGICREAEFFIGSTTDSTMFTTGLLGLVNWLCNVVMPLYAVFCFAKGAAVLGGFMERFNIGDDWMRYFLTGGGCLTCSGIIRLLEYFVTNSQGGLH
jgi:hypothetical protein